MENVLFKYIFIYVSNGGNPRIQYVLTSFITKKYEMIYMYQWLLKLYTSLYTVIHSLIYFTLRLKKMHNSTMRY